VERLRIGQDTALFGEQVGYCRNSGGSLGRSWPLMVNEAKCVKNLLIALGSPLLLRDGLQTVSQANRMFPSILS